MKPMTWQQRFLAMAEVESRGDELALAYVQGRAIEAGEAVLRRAGAKARGKDTPQRRALLRQALEATAAQVAEAIRALDGQPTTY